MLVVASRRLARPGTVALVAHDALGPILKRVVRRARGRVELCGDNALSIASEQLGPLAERALLGRACLRVSPTGVHWLGKT